MPTTLYQAISSFPGKAYAAFGQVFDTLTGRKAERIAERNQSDLVEFFSEKLVSAFRAGRVRLLPYYDNLTAETPEHRLAYRWLLKEPAIKSSFMGKLLSVMSLDLQVDAASETPRDKEIAAFVEHSLRRCEGGTSEIAWSILFGAMLEGNGLSEKVWGRVERGKYRGRPTISKIKAKDSKDYQITIDEFNNPVLVWSRRTAEEFPMTDFLFWSHMKAFSNPAGMSDLRAVYRAGWMLDTVWKLRAIGLERFTLPVFMSKYPQGRNDIRDSINEAVKKAKSLGYLTVPQEAAVEAVEMASKSGSDFDAAIKGLQEECFIAIQGATLQALAGNVSEGRGNSSVHKSTSELFVWYLSVAVSNVINDQYIPDVVDLNYDDAEYPSAWLGGVNDAELKGALEIDKGLLDLGLVQDPKDLARRYRRQMAKDPQEALQTLKLIRQLGAPPQPPPGGGMGGMGGIPAGLPDDGGLPGGAVPFDESFAEEDWQGPNQGERGGTFWVHKGSGRKVYQKDNPGGHGGEEQPVAPAEKADKTEGMKPADDAKVQPSGAVKGSSDSKDLDKWFGKSLIKNEDGSPLVVYHGTKADFDEFNIRHSKEGRVGKGFYFTASLEEAQGYAGPNGRIIKAHLNIDALSNMTKGGAGGVREGDGKNWGLKTKLTKGGGDVYFVKNPKQIWQIKEDAKPADPVQESKPAEAPAPVAPPAPESPKPAPAPEPEKPFTGKAAGRLRPKPDDWGAPVIPGSTHVPKWNIATSTGYKRAKPLIDEARRLHADPSKATPAEVRALAQQIASTTGRDALYTLAAAIGIKGGSAKSIAERVVAPLSKEELSLPDNDPTKEAALQRRAKEAGASGTEAKQITSYARQLRDDGNKSIDRKNAAIKTAFQTLEQMSGKKVNAGDEAFKTGDHTQLPRFDEVATSVASEFPDLFPDSFEATQAVYELMKEGPDRRLTINDTYEHAFDEWDRGKGSKASVPFREFMESFAAVTWSGPHTGPHGGTFWVNSKTGRHLYQKEKPGAGQEHDGDDPLFVKDPNEPKEPPPAPIEDKPKRSLLKPKPDGWGDKALIPGRTHRGVWNVATSTGYGRAKPVIDEVERLFKDPSKITKADVEKVKAMVLAQKGQDAVYTIAVALGIQGGKAGKVADSVAQVITDAIPKAPVAPRVKPKAKPAKAVGPVPDVPNGPVRTARPVDPVTGVGKAEPYENMRDYLANDQKIKAFEDLVAKAMEKKKADGPAAFIKEAEEHARQWAVLDKRRDAYQFGSKPHTELTNRMVETWKLRNKARAKVLEAGELSRPEFLDLFHQHFGKPAKPAMAGRTAVEHTSSVQSKALVNRANKAVDFYNQILHAPMRTGTRLVEAPGRAAYNYRGRDSYYHITEHHAEDVHVHELGHHIEYNSPGVSTAAKRFLNMRRAGEIPKLMGKGYKPDEVGVDDQFAAAFGSSGRYAGKIYSHGGTEIVSMGFERMYKNAYTLMTKDPEYFRFLVAVATGAFS